jgi:hypothetical protein
MASVMIANAQGLYVPDFYNEMDTHNKELLLANLANSNTLTDVRYSANDDSKCNSRWSDTDMPIGEFVKICSRYDLVYLKARTDKFLPTFKLAYKN